MIALAATCLDGGPVCAVMLGVDTQAVAPFLAWWMPLNFLSWLALVVVAVALGGELDHEELPLKHCLWMTVGFYLVLTKAATETAIDAVKRRRRKCQYRPR